MRKRKILAYFHELIQEAKSSRWEYDTSRGFKLWKNKSADLISEVYGSESRELSAFNDCFSDVSWFADEYENYVNLFPEQVDSALALLEARKIHIDKFGVPENRESKGYLRKAYDWLPAYIKTTTSKVIVGILTAFVVTYATSRFQIDDNGKNNGVSNQLEPAIRISPPNTQVDFTDFSGTVTTPEGQFVDSQNFSELHVTFENSGPILSTVDSLIVIIPTNDSLLLIVDTLGFTMTPKGRLSSLIPFLFDKKKDNYLSLDLYYSSANDSLNIISRNIRKLYMAKVIDGKWVMKLVSQERFDSAIHKS